MISLDDHHTPPSMSSLQQDTLATLGTLLLHLVQVLVVEGGALAAGLGQRGVNLHLLELVELGQGERGQRGGVGQAHQRHPGRHAGRRVQHAHHAARQHRLAPRGQAVGKGCARKGQRWGGGGGMASGVH